MKVYIVIGVWYAEAYELRGVYNNEARAIQRQKEISDLKHYDQVRVQEVELDADLDILV